MKILALFISLALLFQSPPVYARNIRIGTTYSPKQSMYLDQDWKKTYQDILDMGFDIIRLGAYWNEIESKKDNFSFESLDWQIEEARNRKIPVILTVGMKAPRWPEYFIPDWVLEESRLKFGQDVSTDAFLKKRTLKFIKMLIDRYKHQPIIQCWQVENEPLDRAGPNHWRIGRKFLEEEVGLVRMLDKTKRPIMINIATYPNKFLHLIAKVSSPANPLRDTLSFCDILGLNIYPTVGHKLWWFKLYFRTRPKERFIYFSKIVNYAKEAGKKVWITELQAEPWEPGELVHKKKTQPITAKAEAISSVFNEFGSLGIDTVLLWGSEYWHFRKTQHGDESWWKKAEDLLKQE